MCQLMARSARVALCGDDWCKACMSCGSIFLCRNCLVFPSLTAFWEMRAKAAAPL